METFVVDAPEMTFSTVSSLGLTDDDGDDSLAVNLEATVLCGRTRESLQLLKAYSRVIRTKHSEVVMVHGESGSGKTTLIETLRELVCDSRGYFCAGKFFQNSGIKEPYSAIMAAFSDLCDLMSQSDDFDEDRRRDIQQALGPDGYLLSKVISSLPAFISDSQADVDTKNESDFLKFKIACKHFLHVMSSPEHPIVVFIDDIQWMDEASKQLMQMFLHDGELENVLLIFAYRDEEGSNMAGLSLTDKDKSRVVDIQLENLDCAAVHQILSAILENNSEKTRELSGLVWQKTAGNPFHVLQLFESIQREGLLTFSSYANSWEFDVEEIRRQSRVSDSLADLLSRKVQSLAPEVQVTCKIASLLGFRFEESILLEIVTSVLAGKHFTGDDSNAAVSLSEAVKGGFIERTKEGYQFSHDKVQACFQSKMDEAENERLHRLIGECFLLRGAPKSLYHAANHFNQASGLGQSKEQRAKLARLNLEASKYSKDKSAFNDAADFLRLGLKLLDSETKWSHDFDLAFEMTESLAKMEFIIGNFEACKKTTKKALLRAKSVEKKLDLLLVDFDVRLAAHEIDEAIATANITLKLLGIKVPPALSLRHVVFKLLKVKRMLGKKTDADILALPVMQDHLMAAAVRLLFCSSTCFLFKNAEHETAYYTLLATELTLKRGLSPFSAPALALYGSLEVFLGNHNRGYRCGKLALGILEQIKCKEVESATIILCTSTLSHWKEPVNEFVKSFDRAMHVGLETGDVVAGVYALSACSQIRLFIGENLVTLEAYQLAHYQRASEIGQEGMLQWSIPAIQYVLNLQTHASSWRDLISMSGKMMDEGKYIRFAVEAKNDLLLLTVLFFKMQLAYHFGYYEMAYHLVKDCAEIGKGAATIHFNMPLWYFLGASTNYELYRRSGQRVHLKGARKFHNAIKRVKFCPNSTAFLTFLVAEELSAKGKAKTSDVVAAYDRAIGDMAELTWVNWEGLANERVGFHLIRVGNLDQAKLYFDRAMELYRYEWGAIAKYEWLREKSEQALDSKRPGGRRSESVVGNIIDIHDGLATISKL